MINSISIKNFKNLDGFTIDSLSQINLITGKNNTGKSTLLEAIALFVSKANFQILFEMLDDRGENLWQTDNEKNLSQHYLNAFASLFTNRKIEFEETDAIIINGNFIDRKIDLDIITLSLIHI